jgi:hypothetical protein
MLSRMVMFIFSFKPIGVTFSSFGRHLMKIFKFFIAVLSMGCPVLRRNTIMLRLVRLVKRFQGLTRVCLLLLIALPIIVIISQYTNVSYELRPSPPPNLSQYDQFCWRVTRQISLERSFHISHHLTSRNESIPYSYNHWQSSSIMPRRLTPCDHALFIHLLSILTKYIFDKHNISYMMMAGTLLGSYF